MKICLSLPYPHSRICITKYIFDFKKWTNKPQNEQKTRIKQKQQQKNKTNKQKKKLKKKKEISLEN